MPNTTITWDTWWSDTTELLHYPFVHHALLAAALLGIISGLIAPLIVMRRMSFAVHGTSELGLMGASAALLAGSHVGAGAVVTKDVPPRKVVIGSPARVIRDVPDEELLA